MNFNKAEFYTSYGLFSQIPKSEKAEIAFSGRSNVGKSSLINKILNRKSLARVSSMPGKTVTINFYSVDNIYLRICLAMATLRYQNPKNSAGQGLSRATLPMTET